LLRSLASDSSVWRHLAWRDLQSRYAQTRFGPWWSVLSLVLGSTGVSIALSVLNSRSVIVNLEFASIGLALWTMVIAIVVESAGVFEADRSVLLNSSLRPMTSIYRTIWRNYLLFLHNWVFLAVVTLFANSAGAILRVIFVPIVGLLAATMMLLPSFLIGYLTLIWQTGKSVIPSMTNLLFFVTPVMWDVPQDGIVRIIAFVNPLFWPIAVARGLVIDGEVRLAMLGLSFCIVLFGVTILRLIPNVIQMTKKRL